MQRHFAAFREASASAGGRLGFKVAFNPPKVQALLGIPCSLIAGLPLSARETGAVHSLADATDAALEPELAVALRGPVKASGPDAEAFEAIESVMPAIEIVDRTRPLSELSPIIEEGVFQRAVVFGTAMPRPNSFSNIAGTITHGDSPPTVVDVETATGNVPRLLRHIAALLAGCDLELQAGDRLILGSMCPPAKAKVGDRFTLALQGLGSVSIELSA